MSVAPGWRPILLEVSLSDRWTPENSTTLPPNGNKNSLTTLYFYVLEYNKHKCINPLKQIAFSGNEPVVLRFLATAIQKEATLLSQNRRSGQGLFPPNGICDLSRDFYFDSVVRLSLFRNNGVAAMSNVMDVVGITPTLKK
jgi:hypothetical protein